ncbi:hypothetical protein TgHK011_004916 [Trichoderma gracile]|nr:hypothetical protein TgHK011_004916 [Trichoderma gracile]
MATGCVTSSFEVLSGRTFTSSTASSSNRTAPPINSRLVLLDDHDHDENRSPNASVESRRLPSSFIVKRQLRRR